MRSPIRPVGRFRTYFRPSPKPPASMLGRCAGSSRAASHCPACSPPTRSPVGQFTVGEALLRSQLGPAKLVRFAYSDAGLTYYSNGIVATAATIASKPDLVRRFVEATVRG